MSTEIQSGSLELANNSSRQVIVFPLSGPDGSRMIIASHKNMLAMTQEQIRLDMENCLTIAIINPNGTIKTDFYHYCGEDKFYETPEQMAGDLVEVLAANGITNPIGKFF